MDEMVDIVDNNDNVVGQELKYKCHKEKILHIRLKFPSELNIRQALYEY